MLGEERIGEGILGEGAVTEEAAAVGHEEDGRARLLNGRFFKLIEGIRSSGCRACRDTVAGGRNSPERPEQGRAVRRSGIRCSGRIELREREIRPGREEEGQDTGDVERRERRGADAWPYAGSVELQRGLRGGNSVARRRR